MTRVNRTNPFADWSAGRKGFTRSEIEETASPSWRLSGPGRPDQGRGLTSTARSCVSVRMEPMPIDSERPEVSESSAGEVSTARYWWSLGVRTAGEVLLLAAVLVGFLAWWQVVATRQAEFGAGPQAVTLIIADWFPTLWDVELAAIALGVSALVAAAMIAPPVHRGRMTRIAMGSVLMVLVVLSVPLTALVSFGSGGYRVLPEQSEGGCRIVVLESSFLLAGSGSVGIVQPSALTVDWARAYTADDGLRPFSGGFYTLRWEGQVADLQLGGTGGDPIWWTTDRPLICER